MTVESGDPMDRPPVGHHGVDRYDYVEVEGPPHINPDGAWWDATIAAPCPDCRANVFARWIGEPGQDPADRAAWHITVAHDETCPAQNTRERDEHG